MKEAQYKSSGTPLMFLSFELVSDVRSKISEWSSHLQGREMMLVLKKDTLTLLDPLDHTPLHCQPIINIRVWGVGCNSGR